MASRRGPLLALVLILALVAAGLGIQHVLRRTGQIEDCMLAGRHNCAPLETR